MLAGVNQAMLCCQFCKCLALPDRREFNNRLDEADRAVIRRLLWVLLLVKKTHPSLCPLWGGGHDVELSEWQIK